MPHPFHWLDFVIPPLEWARPHLNKRDLKVTLRCSLGAFVALLLQLIGPTRRLLGSGSYLTLMLHFIQPPCDPIALYLEKVTFAAIAMATVWAYACFVMWIAWLARKEYRYNATQYAQAVSNIQPEQVQEYVVSGVFLETSCSIVTIAFAALGLALIVAFRARIASSPHAPTSIATIFQLAIPLSASHLYPVPQFRSGLVVFLPFIIQMAIDLALTFLVFPENLNHRFIDMLLLVMNPLKRITIQQKQMLATDPSSSEWRSFECLQTEHSDVNAAMFRLSQIQYLLVSEVAWCRLGPKDTARILDCVRRVSTSSAGFVKFHLLILRHITQAVEHGQHLQMPDLSSFTIFMGSEDNSSSGPLINTSLRALASSPPSTPQTTLVQEQQRHIPSILVSDIFTDPNEKQAGSGQAELRSRKISRSDRNAIHPVGLYMSSRYMKLENLASNKYDLSNMKELIKLLHDSSIEVLDATYSALAHIDQALRKLKSTSLAKEFRGLSEISVEMAAEGSACAERLEKAMEEYNKVHRLDIVRPFAPLFDPNAAEDERVKRPSHRVLFWSFHYQYTLQKFSSSVHSLLAEILGLENSRQMRRIWIPSIKHVLNPLRPATDSYLEDDPELIRGLQQGPNTRNARNPDLLPPRNLSQQCFAYAHEMWCMLSTPTAVFILKATLLAILLLFPGALNSFAFRFYEIRAVWACILAMMTLSQHVGDTGSGLFWRIIGAFVGSLCGLAVWEISRENDYGLAAAAFVVFLPGSFLRIFHPQPALSIVTLTTFALIIGYGYQNVKQPSFILVRAGWRLTWIRFVLTTIGLVASFLWASLPPRITQKVTLRIACSRTLQEMGHVMADLITYANTKQDGQAPPAALQGNIYAVKGKLRSAERHKHFVSYELNWRGPWPKRHYDSLLQLQLELNSWLSQFIDVLSELPTVWVQAVLTRCRLNDPSFIGQMMSCFHILSSSLRLGLPLPVYCTPLMEEFQKSLTEYKYAVTLKPDPELPQVIDLAALSSVEYSRFSVAVTSAYAINNRLDKLTYVVKELVGESYNCELPELSQNLKEK